MRILLSCSLSFFLSRRYGRGLVQRLVGESFMGRIDTPSQRHLDWTGAATPDR